MKRFAFGIGGVAVLMLFLVLAPGQVLAAGSSFNKANFSHPLNITNKYFPLKAGTLLYYEGETDGQPTSDDFLVTHETKTILGVTARVVRDIGYDGVGANRVLSEKTDDWYAQDDDGNVWYLGEATAEYNPDGTINNTEGSWEAGVKGAKPGIIMEANPRVGDTYYQEFQNNVAEDQATVLSLNQSICVPYGCFSRVLQTKEFTALEPGVVENKYYARGVGEIKSLLVQGGDEESHLVSVTTGQ